MQDINVLSIIIFFIILAIIGGIVYHVLRFMKGKITLSIPIKVFNLNDVINGSFELHTKKAIQGNKLLVSLIGKQISITHKEGKTERRTYEVYKDEITIEQNKTYEAGSVATYKFELPLPKEHKSELANSKVVKTAEAVFDLFDDGMDSVEWDVVVILDAKGVDLKASQTISTNILLKDIRYSPDPISR